MSDLPDWFEEYTRGPYLPMPEMRQSALEWIANLPPVVREMMRKFPPSCVVRATVPLAFPAPGELGVAMSYREPCSHYPNGQMLVRRNPVRKDRDELDAAYCSLDWLEVVGFYQGCDHIVVEQLIAEALRLHQKDN